jgi:hypothetical protein
MAKKINWKNSLTAKILGVLVLALIIRFLVFLYLNRRKNVEHFEDLRTWIVFVYADNCKTCQTYDAAWKDFAAAVDKPEYSNSGIFALKSKDAVKYTVKTPPAIIAYRSGRKQETFSGKITKTTLIDFAKAQAAHVNYAQAKAKAKAK